MRIMNAIASLFLSFLFHSQIYSFDGTIITTNPKIFIRAPYDAIVQEIEVKNVTIVNEGEVLLKLDVSQELDQQNKLKKDYLKIQAIQSRLNAHSRDRSSILYPRELTSELTSYPELKTILDTQKKEFTSLQNEQQELQRSLDEKNHNIKTIMIGIEDRLRIAEADLAKITEAEQIALKRIEIPYGKYKVDNIRTIKGRAQAKVDSIRMELQNAQDQMNENNAQYNDYLKNFKGLVKQGLEQSQSQLENIKQQLIQLQYKIDSATIQSPILGSVDFADQFSISQMVHEDQLLMTITPLNYSTLIESHLPEKPLGGLKEVTVDFKQNDMPKMKGEISYITPGPVEIDGKKVFILYIKVPNQNLENYPPLLPGTVVDIAE